MYIIKINFILSLKKEIKSRSLRLFLRIQTDMCARARARARVCVCVCVRARVCVERKT